MKCPSNPDLPFIGNEFTLANWSYSFEDQIDAMIYELYGLTEEEIKIVEGKCV